MIRVCQAAPFYFAYTLTNNLQLDILNRWEEKLCFANTHIQSLRFKCPDARSQLCHTHPHNNTCRRTLHTCTAQLHTRTAHSCTHAPHTVAHTHRTLAHTCTCSNNTQAHSCTHAPHTCTHVLVSRCPRSAPPTPCPPGSVPQTLPALKCLRPSLVQHL